MIRDWLALLVLRWLCKQYEYETSLPYRRAYHNLDTALEIVRKENKRKEITYV